MFKDIEKWDKEADVVVIGYGGAGAVAAITACEKGGTVIILEKAPEPGGNTGASSGGMTMPDVAEKAAKYVRAVGLGSIDDEMATAYAEAWIEIEPWFKRHGGRLVFAEHTSRRQFPGVDAPHKTASIKTPGYKAGSGKMLFSFLDSIVRKLAVEVMLSTPAKRLIQDPGTKEILGVRAESGGTDIAVKAKKAVIMTCGGFEGNPDMLATYIESAPVPLTVSGTPYNTGDGIKMVIDVGADLWHMNEIEWGRQGLKVPELPAAFWLSPRAGSWINVNRYGERFMNEDDTYAHTKKHLEVFNLNANKTEWPNYPWYMIFDEKTREAGSIILREKQPGRTPYSTYNLSAGLYDPSPDNMREIEKGWIKRADTIAELAAKTGAHPSGLHGTIAKYNEYCNSRPKFDPDFHRDPGTLEPVDKPPYYSVECAVNIINTQGGPRRNAQGQVMNPYGSVIPRLYAGGEFGSIWGYLYPGSCNLPECFMSGLIAGRAAVAESPRA
jgi:succinate dehydrogenase/fumarate reductase flavoprotein subunit